ncbi:MAG: tetratricopeptide repeat protein [Planctomycetes bacterium]|nr:tetratricopeptide repeat protein [Planctomycetota bacterium]
MADGGAAGVFAGVGGRATARRWGSILLAALVLAGLGFVAYRNSFTVPFVYDDEPAIPANPRIRSLWPFGMADYNVQSTECGRPLVRLSLALNYALGRYEVRGYHVFNLALHVLSALLLFSLVQRTLRLASARASRLHTAAPCLALITAALWLVHPLQTDAVTYVIQRTELLMGFFYLATLSSASASLTSPSPRAWCVLGVLCCALGMASKEAMASAPLVVALYDRAFAFPSWGEMLRRRRGFYAGLASTWLVLAALVVSGPRDTTVGFGLGVAWWEYGATQLGMILHYLRLAFWPDELCLDYGRGLARGVAEILPGALVVGALVALTIWGIFRRPVLGFLGAFFFGILAPSSSVVPIITEVGAERRMYLSLAVVLVVVVLGAYGLLSRVLRRSAGARDPALGAVALLALAALAAGCLFTARRNEVFQSELSLWTDTVAKRPDNPAAHNNLGRVYAQTGRVNEAFEQFTIATGLPQCGIDAYNNLGTALCELGRLDESVACFQNVLRQKADNPGAYEGLGAVLSRQRKWPEAVEAFQKCVSLGYRSADVHSNLGRALFKAGRDPEAIQAFQKALELEPGHEIAAKNLKVVQDLLKKAAETQR